MNDIERDKHFAFLIARAGCVNALGIMHGHGWEPFLPRTNAQRTYAWRGRANEPGQGNALFTASTSTENRGHPCRGEVGASYSNGDC